MSYWALVRISLKDWSDRRAGPPKLALKRHMSTATDSLTSCIPRSSLAFPDASRHFITLYLCHIHHISSIYNSNFNVWVDIIKYIRLTLYTILHYITSPPLPIKNINAYYSTSINHKDVVDSAIAIGWYGLLSAGANTSERLKRRKSWPPKVGTETPYERCHWLPDQLHPPVLDLFPWGITTRYNTISMSYTSYSIHI